MNVQFEDRRSQYTVVKKNGISSFVIKLGLAKDTKGAQVVLLVVIVVALVIAFAVPLLVREGAPVGEVGDPITQNLRYIS